MNWISGTEPASEAERDATASTLTQFVTELRTFGDGPVPDPTPELEALLRGSSVVTLAAWRTARQRSRPHRALIIATAAAVVITGTGVAAANDTLPQPAQRFVSGVVNDFTPLHIDAPGIVPRKPHPRPIAPPKPSPATDDPPAPAAEASPTAQQGDSHATPDTPETPETSGTPGREPSHAESGPGAEDSAVVSKNPAPGASDHHTD
jgi:hypothetical protein